MKTPNTLFIATVFLVTWSVAHSDGYSELKEYYERNLPGEQFLPTPYGADDRFRPKTIWVYLEDLQNRPTGARGTSGWVVASSGLAIYDNNRVPVYSRPITLPVAEVQTRKQWSLLGALTGLIGSKELEAELEAARESGLELRLDLGTAEIQYAYYFDMLIAQEANVRNLERLNAALEERHKKNIPKRRVIFAALRVKDAVVELRADAATKAGLSAKLSSWLGSLGFSWSSENELVSKLVIEDWRYIAYQAKFTDEYGKVSTGAGAADFDQSQFGNSLPNELLPWN